MLPLADVRVLFDHHQVPHPTPLLQVVAEVLPPSPDVLYTGDVWREKAREVMCVYCGILQYSSTAAVL